MTTYVEQDCTFEYDGRTFEAGGAVVTPEFATGYLAEQHGALSTDPGTPLPGPSGRRLVLTTWHGEVLGPAYITATWKTPRSYVSDRMHQVEVQIDGRTYTGRSAGIGMIWRGRLKRSR